ncbi:MAG TPA: hypothetical protein VL463_34630 [Kofleriaceae bacterium]|jgi:L-ascorbate metabolism protein UlaG (beta-lactamase superfamily)|nr:hypothetical protein [Kofleriaceae bacterium]
MRVVAVLLVASCSGPMSAPASAPDAAASSPPDAVVDASPPTPLTVQWLGVQGYLLSHGGESVLTAPLFTRASLVDVSVNAPTPADTAAIDANLPPLDDLRAIVSGHAHYDHLMDVPRVMTAHAPSALLYANLSARHIFAALAPDSCGTPPASIDQIDRARVIALDDPLASAVDYRNCPSSRPEGAPLAGSWVRVPGSHIRLYAICSEHPAQVGIYHFGAGSIDADLCALPSSAGGWLEGRTLAFLIDFLDDADQPAFRIYYQDAPTNAPIGNPPADVIADHPVDVALLNVGNYDQVRDQPTEILQTLTPRFAISGHWEDFFQPLSSPLTPLPFENVDTYRARADALMPTGRSIIPTTRGQVVIVPPP